MGISMRDLVDRRPHSVLGLQLTKRERDVVVHE